MSPAQELEQIILKALTEPQPQPKYSLWQRVKGGRIIGFYWVSVAHSFHNEIYPGWYYMVEGGWEHTYVPEEDIELREDDR